MKKNLFFVAAASALLLTACSSENDLVQTGPQKTVENQAVGFDIYTPAATNATRAGQEGTMTTDRIQRSQKYGGGFGVYAFKTEDNDADGDDVEYTSTAPNKPNFMVNEKILWDTESMGWYYSPIKYWPNETDNDSQENPATMDGTNKHTDRLTFFAYAPYVTDAQADGSGTGIVYVSTDAGKLNGTDMTDPAVSYKAVLDNPNNGVDLLWGVAPAGGLNYTAVNGNYVTAPEGLPLKNMIKPNVNTNMKFLFQHALARINIKAVAAVDQLSAGGNLDPNTRITINKITLEGYFGDQGDLNLNNTTKDVANWFTLNEKDIATTTTLDGSGFPKRTITITANATGTGVWNGIAEHLRFVGDHDDTPDFQEDRVGVTTVLQNVLEPVVPTTEKPWSSSKTYTEAFPYSETTPYYADKLCTSPSSADLVPPTAPAAIYTKTSKGEYKSSSSVTSLTYPDVNEFYELTFKKVVNSVSDVSKEILVGDAAGKQAYTQSEPSTGVYLYTPKTVGVDPVENDYVIVGDVNKATFKYDADTYYTRDASYYMVVPTYNAGIAHSTLEKKLRTITVTIEYYITTEDDRLNAKRTQTKNVVKKDVEFPSLRNGKSYNLNLILGLTSVKFEAEVDDWRVTGVNGYLPQNTGE